MLIEVRRHLLQPVETIGEIYVNDAWQGYTLEPGKGVDKGPVPAGTYDIELYPSPHFQFTVPLLKNVPGFSFIEIHPLNYPSQTHGCIGVGDNLNTIKGCENLVSSVNAFKRIMNLVQSAINNKQKVQVNIQDPVTVTTNGDIIRTGAPNYTV